jgi:hypothetical protein
MGEHVLGLSGTGRVGRGGSAAVNILMNFHVPQNTRISD